MSLITLILVIAIVGVILYLVNAYVPMDGKIKTILNWTVVVVLVIWILGLIGILPLADIQVPRVR